MIFYFLFLFLIYYVMLFDVDYVRWTYIAYVIGGKYSKEEDRVFGPRNLQRAVYEEEGALPPWHPEAKPQANCDKT
jgi:hypothetical protein